MLMLSKCLNPSTQKKDNLDTFKINQLHTSGEYISHIFFILFIIIIIFVMATDVNLYCLGVFWGNKSKSKANIGISRHIPRSILFSGLLHRQC